MNRFKQCREAAGLTQQYVAVTLNVAPPSVSNWESGKTKPTIENLEMLADLYGVSIDYLLGRKPNATMKEQGESCLALKMSRLNDRQRDKLEAIVDEMLGDE